MNISKIKKVMKKYGEAWEKQNTDLILECFTKKGIYQESPISKPCIGHAQIKKFWDAVVVKNTKNIKFKLGKCYVSSDGKTGFAEWECVNNQFSKRQNKWQKDYMVGIMILKMKNDKITYLNEYWNTKKL
jgi:ketosteroid isomerase-like protein